MGDVLSGKNRALLYRQIGEMASSGLPIERIFTLAAGSRSGRVGAALDLVASKLRAGWSLGEALGAADRKFPGLFADWEIQFIAFGEKSGHLPDFLLQLSEQAEEAHALWIEILPGLAYPVLLLYLAILAGPLAFLILSGPAPYLAAVSGPLATVTATLGLGVYGFTQPRSRALFLRALLPIPLLGKLVAFAGLYRWASSLALAYRGGLPLDQAWPMAAEASNDPRLIEAGRVVRTQILAGREVSPVLQRYRAVFPQVVLTAYQSGEATGRLDSELLHAARFLRHEIGLLRKLMTRLGNNLFFLIVAGLLVRNVLDMYRGPLELLRNLGQNLP